MEKSSEILTKLIASAKETTRQESIYEDLMTTQKQAIVATVEQGKLHINSLMESKTLIESFWLALKSEAKEGTI